MTEVIGRALTTAGEGPVPPQALDAERSVLAALLLDAEATGRAIERIEASTFYRLSHQRIYDAIVALYNRSERPDLVTLAEELRRRGDLEVVGGVTALGQILEHATTSANLEQHIKIIHSKAILRGLIKATTDIQQDCYSGTDDAPTILDRAEQRIFQITDQRVRQGFVALRDLLKPAIEHTERLSRHRALVTGVPSGYEDLDRETAGFQPSDLIVLAGRPSMGKTSFALNIAENAAMPHDAERRPVPVAVFSLEMSKEQLVLRLLCSRSEIPLHKLRNGFLASEDWPRLIEAANHLMQAPVMIDDSPSLTVMEVRAKCRRLKSEGKLGLVIIDYLQFLRPSGPAENRVQEISQITRGLKALAKELNVPIIVLSQLSRATETRDRSGRPQLSDLRDSGAIEQDADVVLFVYREVVYKKDTPEPMKAEIMIAKQRNGPTRDIDMTFLRECTKFVPYSPMMPGETEPFPGP